MINLLEKINEDDYSMIKDSPYIFDNHKVPRVTNIISSMIHEDYLMGWSNYLGFKRQKYKETLEIAAQKGTYTHEFIERFIQDQIEPRIQELPIQYRTDVDNAYSSFKLWWSIISKNEVEILYQEVPLICKWYGGTADIIMKINGKIYLFDFKTSNHPSYKHFIQISTYVDMLYNIYGIKVDGCGTIMLSKNSHQFEEILLDLSDPSDIRFLENCKETFHSLVYSYYNRLRVELEFKDIIKRVN